MDKFQKAIVNYVQSHEQVKKITKEIGNKFSKCLEGNCTDYHEETWESCLILCYRQRDDPEKLECEHCQEAHKLIQQRKKLRIKFGRAKSWITKLGKESLKSVIK